MEQWIFKSDTNTGVSVQTQWGILYSHKNKDSVNEPWGHYAKWSKPQKDKSYMFLPLHTQKR